MTKLNRKQKRTPLVSVIMPVYNQERYVADAVRSILSQTFRSFEFVIVDDGSTDKTVQIIRDFNDSRIRLFQADHKGFLSALKLATSFAVGKWLARMDSDDVSAPERLEKQIAFLTAHPECLFAASSYGIVTPNGKFLAPSTSSDWSYLDPKDITLATRLFADPSVVFDREASLRCGYDERWENEKPLWYKLLREGKGAIMDEALIYVRWRMGSHSRGQQSYSGCSNKEIRLAYDAENANSQTVQWKGKANLRNERRCVYFYTAAGDFEAARQTALSTLRQNPLDPRALKLLAIALGFRRITKALGPANTQFYPVPSIRALID